MLPESVGVPLVGTLRVLLWHPGLDAFILSPPSKFEPFIV